MENYPCLFQINTASICQSNAARKVTNMRITIMRMECNMDVDLCQNSNVEWQRRSDVGMS